MSLLFDFFSHRHKKLIDCLLNELVHAVDHNPIAAKSTLLKQKVMDLSQTLLTNRMTEDEDMNIVYQLMIDELNQLIKRVNGIEVQADIEEVVKRMHHTKELFQRTQ
ncbi:hypothetical protein QBE53_11685 [Vallitaleaceae bacterium 9-2]